MPRHFLPALRAASLAALPALLLAVSAACSHESDATGPLAERETQVPRANLGAIPTDPILEIVSALTEAWTAKDASAYAAPYAPDLQFVNPLGALIAGREAYRAQHEFLFNGPFAGSTLTLVVRDIQFLTGTIAIVYLDTALSGYAFLPPGLPSSGGVQRNRSTWVVEKRGGEWQIVFQQYTPQL
ncbi:MAG TPA: SgcJ/EcaC family oxidoreductase [Gemmatimonadales bacterium]|nr:SgcJ/EcaC family oxidoreductase [Gemmatimonadales bacterium]